MYVGTVEETVKPVASNLRDQYIENRFNVSEEGWPPVQPKHYTSLGYHMSIKKRSQQIEERLYLN